MLPIIRTAIESDFDGILALQSRNLYTNLSPTELAGGFVTTPFTSDLLEQLLIQDGVFVAESESKIVGYLLAGDWEFYAQWEIYRTESGDRMPNDRAIAEAKTNQFLEPEAIANECAAKFFREWSQ